MELEVEEARNLYQIFTSGFLKKRFSGQGVVLDASRPYRNMGNYFVRVKIVDESLNQFTQLEYESSKQKHIVMLLISPNKEELPRVEQIGSVLTFEDVSFKDRTKYVQGTSKGNLGKFKLYSPDECSKMKSSSIRSIFEWSKEFFGRYSLMKMEWFQPNEGGTFLEDFDYILKVMSCVHSKNTWTISYNDLKGQQFCQQFPGKKNLNLHFQQDDVIKVRSIASVTVTEKERFIQSNKYTTLLVIPQYFRDWKVFNDPNYDAREEEYTDHPTTTKKFPQEPAQRLLGFDPTKQNPLKFSSNVFVTDSELVQYGTNKSELLKKVKSVWSGFDTSGYTLGSHILKEYYETPITKMSYLLTGKLNDSFYRIKGTIHGFYPRTFDKMVIKYCPKSYKTYKVQSKFTSCPESKEKLKNIYLFKILMKDKSIDQDERFLDAYVFTHDENPSPSNFFPRVCLHDYARQKVQKPALFQSLEAMISYLPIKVGVEFQFVVQPCFHKDMGDKVIFRIIDSFMCL